MDDLSAIATVADKVGVIVLMLFGGVALHKKWLVLGWVHTECTERCSKLDTLLTTNAARLESKIEKLEAEREARYGKSSP